jgi:hypothetical protein
MSDNLDDLSGVCKIKSAHCEQTLFTPLSGNKHRAKTKKGLSQF